MPQLVPFFFCKWNNFYFCYNCSNCLYFI